MPSPHDTEGAISEDGQTLQMWRELARITPVRMLIEEGDRAVKALAPQPLALAPSVVPVMSTDWLPGMKWESAPEKAQEAVPVMVPPETDVVVVPLQVAMANKEPLVMAGGLPA